MVKKSASNWHESGNIYVAIRIRIVFALLRWNIAGQSLKSAGLHVSIFAQQTA